MNISSERKSEASKEKFWLYAFRDHLANVRAFSNCIETADVHKTGDYQLLVADGSKRIKVYSGTSLQRQLPLYGVPSAMTSFVMDNDNGRKPVIAVSTGPFIFMYSGHRPLFRYMVPPVPLDQQELAVWENLANGTQTLEKAVEVLEGLIDAGVQTSARTLELLLKDNLEDRNAFVASVRSAPLIQMDVICCLASIPLDTLDEGAASLLVIGTEAGFLYILKNTLAEVVLKVVLPSAPVFLITAGCYQVDYRIIVSCRDGRVYSIKKGYLHTAVIQPDSQPCAIARYDNLVAVATTSNTLSCYNLKGKKQQSVFFPCPITNLSTITDSVTGEARGLVVALSNGELRVYVGTQLRHVSLAYGKVTAMRFCRYGRADGALVLVLQNGSLVVQLLHRSVNLSSNKEIQTGPPPQQDVPIPVPHLSSVFATQSSRERKYGADIYQNVQYKFAQLRLTTAKAYLEMIRNGAVPSELGNVKQENETEVGSSLRLNALVQGLGPVFKVKVQLQNGGEVPIRAVRIVFCLPEDGVYRMQQQIFSVPTLLPSALISCAAVVTIAEGEVQGDAILVVVTDAKTSKPLTSTLVSLPEAELIDGLQF